MKDKKLAVLFMWGSVMITAIPVCWVSQSLKEPICLNTLIWLGLFALIGTFKVYK